MESWEEYWHMFDQLCRSLEQSGHGAIVHNLRESQRYVNGLTDGWWDFLENFRTVVKNADVYLRGNERELIATLDRTLHAALTKR